MSALLRAERIICLSSQYPEPVPHCGTWSGPLRGSLFGLAPDGVFRASALALGAVGSYPTFSPLPALLAKRRRYLLCGTFRRHASRHGLPRVSVSRPSCVGLRRLRGIAPCGVRTFLLPRIAPGKAILRPSKIKHNVGPFPWVGKLLRVERLRACASWILPKPPPLSYLSTDIPVRSRSVLTPNRTCPELGRPKARKLVAADVSRR